MWSKSGTFSPKGSEDSNSNTLQPSSFIGEEFSQADYLKKSAIAKSLTEMKTEVEFSGISQFKVIKSGSDANQSKEEVSLYEEYIGNYKLARNIEVGGVARFDEPHLSISKYGKMESTGGTRIDYTITILNDGNRALGPIHVLDLFPAGTEYVYSSLRPSELNESYAKWTLLSLGVGASSTIELKLNMTEDADNLVNRVQASGGYDRQWITAENFSSIQFNWLSCCPPQIWATKTAYVDPKDATMVHYSIILRNREKYIMAASITDQLPSEMMFQNSSIMPSDLSSNEVRWNIMDLKPGETKAIDYIAKALQNGVFVNKAHIEVHAVNGPDSASADVAARVEIGGDERGHSSSTWQPPVCFGLNYTQQGSKDEWIPCDTCGAKLPETQISLVRHAFHPRKVNPTSHDIIIHVD